MHRLAEVCYKHLETGWGQLSWGATSWVARYGGREVLIEARDTISAVKREHRNFLSRFSVNSSGRPHHRQSNAWGYVPWQSGNQNHNGRKEKLTLRSRKSREKSCQQTTLKPSGFWSFSVKRNKTKSISPNLVTNFKKDLRCSKSPDSTVETHFAPGSAGNFKKLIYNLYFMFLLIFFQQTFRKITGCSFLCEDMKLAGDSIIILREVFSFSGATRSEMFVVSLLSCFSAVFISEVPAGLLWCHSSIHCNIM